MFFGASAIHGDISTWRTDSVTNMSYMFLGANAFNRDISGWVTSSVTNMRRMFYGASAFNGDISLWDTSSVTNMESMFFRASAFNQDISGWITSSVTDMSWMFSKVSAFNADISGWVTSSVTDMSGMFSGASAFNADISGWVTNNVTDMSGMFIDASAFNQDISDWVTNNVTNMSWMFFGASAFNQDIGDWNVTALTKATDMFHRTALSTYNYDALLIGWAAQSLQSGVTFHGGSSTYCKGERAREKMIDTDTGYAWTITDGGKDCITVTINQAVGQPDPTIASPIHFTAVFNEPIDLASFEGTDDVLLGGTAGATTAVVTQIAPNDGTTFEIAVSGMTAYGTVTASIPYSVVEDLDGHINAASTSTDNLVQYGLVTIFPIFYR